jgi:hypothetical protein
MPPPRQTFSFKALLLAPLAVPLIYAAVFSFEAKTSSNQLALFAVCAVFGLVISASGTVALAAALLLTARLFQPAGRLVVASAGVVLAGLGYLAFAWINYKSSGPDSGPPEGTFTAFLLRPEDWWAPVTFLVAGLVNALLYDALVRRFTRAAA